MSGRALPEDSITEILLRLPVKSLLRFRCVRKSWNHLILSPEFIKNHLKHHSTKKECILISRRPHDETTPPLSLYSYDSLDLISPDLQIPVIIDTEFPIELCGPCNGLVCVSINNQDIMLCNPFLREFKLLPSSPFSSPPGYQSYDEGIGFWFDSGTEGYKVMRIVKHVSFQQLFSVEIYNSSTNSWRIFENHKFDNQNRLNLSPGTNMNEVIYWVNCRKEILSFDMKTEVFKSIALPAGLVEEWALMQVIVLNESLAVFAMALNFDPEEQFVDLWKMEIYGVQESWTKLLTIGPESLIETPLLFWKDEAIIFEAIDLPFDHYDKKGNMLACTAATMKSKDLKIYGKCGYFRVLICNESMVSIK